MCNNNIFLFNVLEEVGMVNLIIIISYLILRWSEDFYEFVIINIL